MHTHSTKLFFHQNHGYHHYNRKKCIIVIGNSSYKHGHSILSRNKTADSSCPGWDWCNDTYRRSCGIDQVCQLRAWYIVLICDWSHNTAYRQTVEIIINKNQHSKQNGCQLCPNSCLDVFACPASKSGWASSPVHQADHSSKNYQEHQNTYVTAGW